MDEWIIKIGGTVIAILFGINAFFVRGLVQELKKTTTNQIKMALEWAEYRAATHADITNMKDQMRDLTSHSKDLMRLQVDFKLMQHELRSRARMNGAIQSEENDLDP